MKINKLELCGFKSFRDKTTMEFPKGLTGIVGPNGCGKSNLVDAMLWVMGETSAKNLRGQHLSDVIFSGTATKPQSDFVEVSLFLDKGSSYFPKPYKECSELKITRKSYRNGESECLINGSPVRLRDIREIFMDTGAGCRGFSIIEQESIERLVSSKPHERRFLIEEVAGITKFKSRKGESERKLEKVKHNLKRIEDIIRTQTKQLNQLKRQASQAEKYRNIKEEIRSKELELLYRLHEEMSSNQTSIQERRKSINEKQTLVKAHIKDNEKLLVEIAKDIKNESSLIEKENAYLSDINCKVIECEKEIEKGEIALEIYNKDLKRQTDSQGGFHKDIASSKNQIKELEAKIKNLKETEINLEKEIHDMERAIEDSLNLESITKEIQEVQNTIENQEKGYQELLVEKNTLEAKILLIKKELDQIKIKKEEIEKLLSLIQKEEVKTRSHLQNSNQIQLNLHQDTTSLQENLKILKQQKVKVEAEHKELLEKTTRISYKTEELKNLMNNFKSTTDGLKALMDWEGKGYRLVAQSLTVDPDYENALTSALGPYLNAVVPEDQLALEKGVNYLKEHRKGLSYFLSNLPVEEHFVKRGKLENYPAFKGFLSEKVNTNGDLRNLKLILQNTAIVSNLQSAFDIKPKFPNLNFVTKDGDLLTQNGIVHAGFHGKDTNFLKIQTQITELEAEKKIKEILFKNKTEEMKKIHQRIEQTVKDFENQKNKSNQTDLLLTGYKKDLERLQAQQTGLQEDFATLQEKEKDFISKTESLKQEMKEKSHNESFFTKSLLRDRDLLKSLNKRVQKALEHSKESDEKKQSLEMSQFKNLKDQESIEQEIRFLTDQMSLSQGKKEDILKTRKGLEESVKKESFRISEIRKELLIHQEEKTQVEERIANFKLKLEEKTTNQGKLQSELEEYRGTKTSLELEAGQEQSEEEKVQFQKKNLKEKLLENYQIQFDKDVFVPQYQVLSKEKLQASIEELQATLNRIGTVNLLALKEYEDLLKENNFLNSQKEDLVSSNKELRQVIAHIDRLCDKRFKEMLDEINARFSKIFPVVFEGENSEAKLILRESEESGELGVDIMVRPPGKKAQSVTLLSKGEKALTSICLIYALFLVKPSPFCILDEIDAPLDDANILRFISVLKEMVKRSQIVIISHNKYTMKACKSLYGVTMEEKGISQLVSVNLEKASDLSL